MDVSIDMKVNVPWRKLLPSMCHFVAKQLALNPRVFSIQHVNQLRMMANHIESELIRYGLDKKPEQDRPRQSLFD